MNFNFTFPPTFEETPSSPPVMSPLSSEEQYSTVELDSQHPALEEVLLHPALQQYVRRFEEICVVPKGLVEYVQLHLEELLSVLNEAHASMAEECSRDSAHNASSNNSSSNNRSNSSNNENSEEDDSDVDDDDNNSNDAEPKCSTWISNCINEKSKCEENEVNFSNKENENDQCNNEVIVRSSNIIDIATSRVCNDNPESSITTNEIKAESRLRSEECEVPELILSAKNVNKHYDPTCNFVSKPHTPLSCDCNSFDSINEINVINSRATIPTAESSHNNSSNTKEVIGDGCNSNVLHSENEVATRCGKVKEEYVDEEVSSVDKNMERLRCANAGELLLAYMIDTTSVYLIDKLVPIYLKALCGVTPSHSMEKCNVDNSFNDALNNHLLTSDSIISVECAHHALLTCFDTSFVETTKRIKNALTPAMVDRITANLHSYSVVETLISLFGSALPASTMMAASTEPWIFTEHWVKSKFVERAVERLPYVIGSCAHYNYFQFWREVIKRGFGHSAGPIADVFLQEECINFFVQTTIAECRKLIRSTCSTKKDGKETLHCSSSDSNNNNKTITQENESEVHRSSLCGEAISILVTIVNFVHRASITTCHRDMYYTSIIHNAALHAIVEHLPEFVSLLNPQHTLVVENECLYITSQRTVTTSNHTIRLLGNVRLQICKLCLELLQLNRYDIDKALIDSHFLPHLVILCRMYSQHAKLSELLQTYLLHIVSRVPLEHETYLDLLTHDAHWVEYLASFSEDKYYENINHECTTSNQPERQSSFASSSSSCSLHSEMWLLELMKLCQQQLYSLLSHRSHILHHLAEYAKDVTLLHTSLSANAIYTLEQMHVLLNTALVTLHHSTCTNTSNLYKVDSVHALEEVYIFLTQTLQETMIRERLENINHGIEGVDFASPETLILPVVIHKPVINFAPDREVSSPSTFTSPLMSKKWMFIKSDKANTDLDKYTEEDIMQPAEEEMNFWERVKQTSTVDDNTTDTDATDAYKKNSKITTNKIIILPWIDSTTPDEALYKADDVVMVDVDNEDGYVSKDRDNNSSNHTINKKENDIVDNKLCRTNFTNTPGECNLQKEGYIEIEDDYVLERTLTSVLTSELVCESNNSWHCQRKHNVISNECISREYTSDHEKHQETHSSYENEERMTGHSEVKANDISLCHRQYPLLITNLNNAEPKLLLAWEENAKLEEKPAVTMAEKEPFQDTNGDLVTDLHIKQESDNSSAMHDNATQNDNECSLAKNLPPELAEILKEGVAVRRTGSPQVQAYPCFQTVYFGFRPNDSDYFAL